MSRRFRNSSPGDDVIDIRNIIERFEELEELCGDETIDKDDPNYPDEEDKADYQTYLEFLENVAGSGGDHQWRGSWYPVTFILDPYFPEYAEQYAADIGAIKSTDWPMNCIDWDQAAKQLQSDFSSVEFGNYTYLYQS